jgi:hypothetical protein
MSDLQQIGALNRSRISEYLVKPFDPVVAIPRLRRLLASLPPRPAPRPERPAPLDQRLIPILLVSAWEEATAIVRGAMGPHYHLSVVTSGPSAMIKAIEIQPYVVFVTGDLLAWDMSKTLQSLLALRTPDRLRVFPLPHRQKGATVIAEAVRRDLNPLPFSVACARTAVIVTLEATFRASCLGALREAIGSAVDGTIDRVVFDLPPEGIGEHLFPALQDLAHFCKPDG